MSDSPGNLRRFFRKILEPSPAEENLPLRAVELRVAKDFVKRRLLVLYPELHGNAAALERAYQELDLEARGTLRRSNDEVKTFSLRVSDDLDEPFDRK